MHGNEAFVHDVLCKRIKLPNLYYEEKVKQNGKVVQLGLLDELRGGIV